MFRYLNWGVVEDDWVGCSRLRLTKLRESVRLAGWDQILETGDDE